MPTASAGSELGMQSDRHASPLPYALGFVGGLVPLSVLCSIDSIPSGGPRSADAWVLSVCLLSGLVSACVGVLVRDSRSWTPFVAAALGAGTTFGTFVAGATAALALPALILAMPIAFALAVGMTGVGAIVFAAHRRWLGSRPGSLLGQVDLPSIWLASGASIVAAGFVFDLGAKPSTWRLLIVASAFFSMLVSALGRRSAVDRLRLAVRAARAPVHSHQDALTLADFGVGEERWQSSPDVDAYRSAPQPLWVIRGALDVARRRARLVGRIDAVLILLGLLALACVARSWLTRREPSEIATPSTLATSPPKPAPHWRTGAWYPDQDPILVDIDHDGIEDLVSLRWDSAHPENALFLAAHDGASFSELWSTEPIPSQWMSADTHLARSGSTLFLSDSERHLHVYDLATGLERGRPLAIDGVASMCVPEEPPSSLWLLDHRAFSQHRPGLLVSADGSARPAERPKSCRAVGPSAPALGEWEPKCEKKLRKPDRLGAAYRRDGDLGVGIVAFGSRPFLFGYDPNHCAEKWQTPIVFDDEPMHPNPHLMNRVVRGRVHSLYQLASGRWVVGARDEKSGHVEWYRLLPEAERGTDVEALFVSAERVYVARAWRLDVLDLDAGRLLGWI